MKFIELEIKNIASIGYAKISFDEAPLCNEPLFLICGPTGSGKSTILDAVCLALYGTAPRLDGYGNESFEDKKLNVFGSDDAAVKISSPYQMVRRNTGEAFARLTFIGNDDKLYTASWHAMRGTKKRLDVKLKAEQSLYCHDTGTTISKKAVDAVVSPSVIGLKFDEFCRTTLLAQGAFTRFLNSRSNEKSAILEKLTGTEIYSRISRQIYRTYDEKNRLFEEKNRVIAAYRLLTPQEREERVVAMAALEKELEALRGEILAMERATAWFKGVGETSAAMKLEAQRLEEAKKMLSSDETVAKQRTLSDWSATEELRSNYSRLKQLLRREQEILENIKHLHGRYSLLCAGSAEVARVAGEYDSRLQRIKKQLETIAGDIPMYENASHLMARMEEMLRLSDEMEKCRRDIELNARNLHLTRQQLSQLEKLKVEVEQILIEKRKAVAAVAEKIEKEPSVESIIKLREDIDSLASILKDWETAATTIVEERQKCERLSVEVKRAEEEFSKCAKEKSEAEENYGRQSEIYEKMHLRIDNHAKALRARLSQGDICPVCGETINTLVRDEDILALLLPLKEKLDEAKKLSESRVDAYNKACAALDAAKRMFEESSVRLAATINEEKKYAAGLKAKCRALSIPFTTADELKKYIENSRKEADLRQQERERLTKEYRKVSAEVDTMTGQLNDVLKKYGLALQKHAQIASAIETRKRQVESSADSLENLRKELASQITIADWQLNIKDNIQELRRRSTEYNKAKEEAESIRQQLVRMAEQQERMALHRKVVEEAYPDFTPLQVPAQKIKADIETEWLKLSQDTLLCRTEFDKNANEIAECTGFIDAFHCDNPAIDRERAVALCGLSQEQVKTIQNEINLLHSNVARNEALLAESERKYNELLSQRPAIDEEETAETLAAKRQSAEERRSECDKMVGAYAAALKQDEERAAMLKKDIEEAASLEKEASRWKRLSDIFGSADGAKFKSIAQSYILLQLLENSNFYLRQFTSRYELTTQPGSLVILVKDREDGDTLRAANTLSGGESFMVSLALALGLSSLNRNNFTPDTLFIDEGFGTLSGDCLNTVIETLEVLHNIGSRRVGIISHVGELYERISTKIEVRKQAGVSEVKITG